ncbi:uncharacterized protein LOC110990246 [Acanthaster planci]|uniref:Uncharacterized protein LOC110990246 n=1 Tax=Acanthaster planci TaxID=133434 RepID=A0A8B8A1H6_ACAPL|nr:uncharacterized protein LOC110990246 [Acanthaster planci]
MSLRQLYKIPREVLVSFDDKSTSIMPTKLIKNVKPGIESGERVEVLWEGEYLPCEVLRFSDDHSDLLFLQRALSRTKETVAKVQGTNEKRKTTDVQDAETASARNSKTKVRRTTENPQKPQEQTAQTSGASKIKVQTNLKKKGKTQKVKEARTTGTSKAKKLQKRPAKEKKRATVLARFCVDDDDVEAVEEQLERLEPPQSPRDHHGSEETDGPVLALTADDDQAAETPARTSLGSPDTISPEQIPYFPELSFLSDEMNSNMGSPLKDSWSPAYKTSTPAKTPMARISVTDLEMFRKMASQIDDLWKHKFVPDSPSKRSSPVPQVTPPRMGSSRPALSNTASTPSDPPMNLSSLSTEIIADHKDSSSSEANFALSLVRLLFSKEEMKASNCRGVRGKTKLDPVRLNHIKGILKGRTSLPPETFEKYWRRDCFKAIDEGCRRLNRSRSLL